MKNAKGLVLSIILGVIVVLTIIFYPLVSSGAIKEDLLLRAFISSLGGILSFIGLIMILPKSLLSWMLSFFRAESALENQLFGFINYFPNYTANLAFFFKLNAYYRAKLIGLIFLIVGLVLMFKFY